MMIEIASEGAAFIYMERGVGVLILSVMLEGRFTKVVGTAST